MKILPANPPAQELPLYTQRVSAGFPSPADDYMSKPLDIHQHLVQHPAATFFIRAVGESMRDIGIFNGDLLIVDNSLTARSGDVVIAAVDGQLTCKILDTRLRQLVAANPACPPISLNEYSDLVIEGVVCASVRYHRERSA